MIFFGEPGGIRTRDPQLRRLLLYPAELPVHAFKHKARGEVLWCKVKESFCDVQTEDNPQEKDYLLSFIFNI